MYKGMDMFNDGLFVLLYEKVFELAAMYTPGFDINIYDEKVKEEIARQFGRKNMEWSYDTWKKI
ncbi:hypothetical protein ACJDU8_23300 [Clostridium sp. WILCCON 0269]|uniref:Uncharacterized protein n=1 Tax=Candidatus Clostridium eludens TaxID=3381663 RepID=A0ABW8SRA0_9CLOT